MNTEAIIKDLNDSMENAIERLHKRRGNGSEAAVSGADHKAYEEFRDELKRQVNRIVDQNKIIFNNQEESKRFLNQLQPSIENLLNKFLAG